MGVQQIAAGLNQPLGIDSGVQTQILLIAESSITTVSVVLEWIKGCEDPE
jgi:choline/glycine/proline betaine transport protein